MFDVPGIVSEVEVNSERASLNASGCTEFMFRAIAGLDDTLKRNLEECTPRNKQSKLKRIIDYLDRYKYHFRNGELTIDDATNFVAKLIELTSLTEQLWLRAIDEGSTKKDNPSGVSLKYDIAIIEPDRGFYWHTVNSVRQ